MADMKIPNMCFFRSMGIGSSAIRFLVNSSSSSMKGFREVVPANDWNRSWQAMAPSQSEMILFVWMAC